MAKRKKQDKVKPDEMLQQMLAAAQSHFGRDSVFVAEEYKRQIWGSELLPLPLCWLLNLNIWPLQRQIMLAGEPKSCKSAFAFEIARQILECGGLAVFIEAENKTSYSLIVSIIGQDNIKSRMIYKQVYTIEDWQQSLTFFNDYCKKLDPDKQWPVVFIVDSVTGTDTEETKSEIESTGYARGRVVADMANSIARYLRSTSTTNHGWPYLWILVNHLKDRINSMNPSATSKRTPGGDSLKYHESYELRLYRKGDIYRGGVHGHFINIELYRSSLGPALVGRTKRRIDVEFQWTYDDEGQQLSWWDWDDALARLLVSDQLRKSGFDTSSVLNVKCSSNRYWTDNERINQRAAELYPEDAGKKKLYGWQLGKLIHSDPELRMALMRALKIQQYEVRYAAAEECKPKQLRDIVIQPSEDGSDILPPTQEENQEPTYDDASDWENI